MRVLHVTTPYMNGKDVRDAEYLMRGNNRYKENYHPGKAQKGVFDPSDGASTKRAKYWLGYPTAHLNSWQATIFGENLYAYLVPKDHEHAKLLPKDFLKRRKARLAQAKVQKGVNEKATDIAISYAKKGYTESPAGSNHTIFGAWYGLQSFWCAIFQTFCQIKAGDKRIFRRGSITAWAYWVEEEARRGHPYLRITHNPVRGDFAVFHHGQGHIGRFVKWVNKSKGIYLSVEGNTSSDDAGSQDNGGACALKERTLSWAPTVFVHPIEP